MPSCPQTPRRRFSICLAPFWMETITWLHLERKKTGDFHTILLLRYFPFFCRIFLAFLL